MDVLLHILEKYAAVLFRSLPRQLLQRILPHGVNISLYRRIGLNVDDPLSQFRPSSRAVVRYLVRRQAPEVGKRPNRPRRHVHGRSAELDSVSRLAAVISRVAKQAALLDLAWWLWDNPDIAHSGPIKPDEVQSRGDLGRLSKSALYNRVLSYDYQMTGWRSSSREEALGKARAVWDDLKSHPNDRRTTPKDPPAKNYKTTNVLSRIPSLRRLVQIS